MLENQFFLRKYCRRKQKIRMMNSRKIKKIMKNEDVTKVTLDSTDFQEKWRSSYKVN